MGLYPTCFSCKKKQNKSTKHSFLLINNTQKKRDEAIVSSRSFVSLFVKNVIQHTKPLTVFVPPL